MKNTHRINGLIYITSEEVINKNDYITDGYKVWKWKDDSSLLGRLKVILSNDQTLTSNGIQAIEPDAVKWLNENPSCEWVKAIPRCEKITCNNKACHDFCQELQYKILQGLETNNGWIKIESEDDLPKSQDTYHVILKNGNQYMRTFADKSSFFDVTHYQPIQKPQPPIY